MSNVHDIITASTLISVPSRVIWLNKKDKSQFVIHRSDPSTVPLLIVTQSFSTQDLTSWAIRNIQKMPIAFTPAFVLQLSLIMNNASCYPYLFSFESCSSHTCNYCKRGFPLPNPPTLHLIILDWSLPYGGLQTIWNPMGGRGLIRDKPPLSSISPFTLLYPFPSSLFSR